MVAASAAEINRPAVSAATGGVSHIPNVENHLDTGAFHQAHVHIRRLAVVIPPAVPRRLNARRDIVPAEYMPYIVDIMHAPVAHLTGPPGPLPVPVIVKFLPHYRSKRRRAGPQIIIDMPWHLHRRVNLAYGLSRA